MRALLIDPFDAFLSEVSAVAVSSMCWVATWCMWVDVFFTVPDAVSTVGTEIFGTPI